MEMKQDTLTVGEILKLRQNNMLTVNPEYQRGSVWNETQKKRLIDSILRGYPIPLIYLHHIKRCVAGMQREDLEVIDGQQRINALYEFHEGAFKLFDPKRDEREAKFPNFIKEIPCPWAHRTFDMLSPELQARFLHTPLLTVKITTDSDNEARDLFIRLQAGLPLNAQEKRDAWPGGFNEFVLKTGGKPEIARYPGHDFFKKLVGEGAEANRGKKRQLCAQMAMLFIERRKTGEWVDISTRSVDDYYYQNLDFEVTSPIAQRFVKTLDLLIDLLGNGRRRRLKGHEAIHLLLFVDSVIDDYTRSWQQDFVSACDRFMEAVAKDKATRNSSKPGEFWINYDARTRTASDRADTIRLRHQFFTQKMLGYMTPLQLKDPKRLFGEVERELIYYRDQRKCAVCKTEIKWSDLEIHHVQGHADGGLTSLENGCAVHSHCHPKGQAATEFAQALQIDDKRPES